MKKRFLFLAGLLAVSAHSMETRFGIGLELSNTIIDGVRNVGTQVTENNITTDFPTISSGSSITDAFAGNHHIGAKKSIAGLKLTSDTKFNSIFSLQGAISINGGSIDLNHQKTGVYYLEAQPASFYKEFLRLRIKPAYSISIRGLFSFIDSFKVGPEFRIQQYKNTSSGQITTVPVDGQVTGTMNSTTQANFIDQFKATATDTVLITNDDDTVGAPNNTNNPINFPAGDSYTAQVTNALSQTTILAGSSATNFTVLSTSVRSAENFYGIAASGMINEFILVNTGYVTARAKQHTFKVDSTINDSLVQAMTGLSSAAEQFYFETKPPSISQYYIETSMYF